MLFGEATANTFPVSSFQKFTDVHCTLEDNPNILISENSTSTWFSKTNFAQRYAKHFKSRNPREIYFLALLFAII
jgi:hypothetical protein